MSSCREIRKAQFSDLEIIHKWTTLAEWNLAMRDLSVFYEAYSDGWFVVEVDGELCGKLTYNIN